jgi:hypothetical protein
MCKEQMMMNENVLKMSLRIFYMYENGGGGERQLSLSRCPDFMCPSPSPKQKKEKCIESENNVNYSFLLPWNSLFIVS